MDAEKTQSSGAFQETMEEYSAGILPKYRLKGRLWVVSLYSLPRDGDVLY